MLQWTRFYLLTMCTSSSHPVTARTLIATLKHQEAWPSCHMMSHSVSVLRQSGPWWSHALGDFVATSLGQSLSLSGPDKLIGLKPSLLLFLLHSNQLKCWRGLTDRFKCKIWIYPLKPKNPSEGCLVFNISSKVRLAGESPAGSSPTEEARRRERRHTGSFCWRYGDTIFSKTTMAGDPGWLTSFTRATSTPWIQSQPCSPAPRPFESHEVITAVTAAGQLGLEQAGQRPIPLRPDMCAHCSSNPPGGEWGEQGAAESLILMVQPGGETDSHPVTGRPLSGDQPASGLWAS